MPETPDKLVNLGGTAQGLPQYVPPQKYSGGGGGEGGGSQKNTGVSFDQMVSSIPVDVKGAPSVPTSAIYIGDRFKSSFPYRNTEEMAAQQQSTMDKWGNGFTKLLGTTSTSFLSGTVGTAVGLVNYIGSGFKFSSIYDNPVNRALDEANKKMEDYFPNYYTQAEKDAGWFSGENLLTANFWSDKVMKNLGYSVGALAGGAAWSSFFKVIGLTNKLVRAGKGLETVTAVDEAIATAPVTGRFGAISNTLNSLSTKYIKPVTKAILPEERFLTSIMGTMGEASFESLQSMNDYRDRLINSYVEEYGIRPTGKDLQEINERAKDVGNFTWGMNVALLTATNYIQLPKLLNSSKSAERRMMNDVVKTKLDDAATLGEKVEAKYTAVPSAFERVAGKPGKLFYKYAARPVSLLFSPAEAFEEGMQSAITTGTSEYFDRAYQNKEDTSSFFNNLGQVFKNVLTEGVNETLSSKEGLESILIGGIAGGLQSSFSPFGTSEVKEKGLFGGGGIRGRNTALAIDELNKSKKLNQVLKDAVKYINIGVNSQMLRREAISENDTLSEKDYEKDYALSYIMPRVKYGKIDSIKEEIDLYKQAAATTEGFNNLVSEEIVLQNEGKEKFLQRLDYIQKSAEDVAKTFEMFDNRYSTILDKDGKRLYDDSVIEKMVYASAKVIDYDDRLASLETNLFERGVDTSNFKNKLVETEEWKKGNVKGALLNPEVEKALTEVSDFINGKEIDSEKTKLKEDFTDFAEMMLRRKTFIDEFNDITKSPKKYQEKPITPAAQPQIDKATGKPKTISIVTRGGTKDIELGVEYFAGRTAQESEKDAEGFPIFKYPKFTFIEELPNGVVKVRAQDGTIHDTKKTAFAKYKFGKVSDVLNNRKAKFYIESAGQLFNFKRKRNGKREDLQGILEWSEEKDVLEFVYKNSKGERESFPVKGDQFVAKKGYQEALITKIGELTAAQKEIINDFKDNPETDSVRSIVSEVANKIYKSSKDRLDEVNQTLKNKRDKLNEIDQSLKNLTETKKGTPRKSIAKAARKTLNELAKLRVTVEKDIENLEFEKESIETSLPYFEDLLNNLTEVGDEKLLIEDLKDNINSLEDLIEKTNDGISSANKLIKNIDEILKEALELVQDFAKRLREENPTLPASLEDLQDRIERFLGEEGAKQFIEQRLGFVQTLTDVEDQIEEFAEELGIPDMTKEIEELREELKKLQTNLDEYINEQSAKAQILAELEETSRKYEEQKEEEELMANNIAIWNEMLGSADPGIQTRGYSSEYEAEYRKDDVTVVTSSKATVSDRPHHVRANILGSNLHTFANRNRIKGVIVSLKNEKEIGLPGLMQFLIDESDATPEEKAAIEPSKTIALVLVEEGADGVNRLIGVDGKPLASPSLNDAVFQVFPDPSLTWSSKYVKPGQDPSMFRKTTPSDTREHYRKQYEQWRNDILDNPSLKSYSIDASFGIPEYVKYLNDEGKEIRDYNAIVPVTDANLISPSDLNNGPVIYIPTVDKYVKKGSTLFESPLGRPFLSTYNAYVKLKNANFTRKKAEVIYEAIYQLSKEIKRDGNAQSDKSKRLTNWLKSVVYWGPPRNSNGYNNIFFERTDQGLMLFVSGKGEKFKFTPSSLEDNKERIISGITGMYHNIRYDIIGSPDSDKKRWKEPYEEIIGFDKNGDIVVREVDGNPFWSNYQTYLLSPKGRPLEELPLFTQMIPVKDKTQESNRTGIYFTVTSLQASYTTPPKKAIVTPIVTPSPTEEELDFTGKTPIQVETEYGKVSFRLNISEFVESKGKNGFHPTFNLDTVDKIKEEKNVDDNAAKKMIAKAMLEKVKPQIDAYKESLSPKEDKKDVPVPTEQKFSFNGEDVNEVETIHGLFKFKLNGKVFLESGRKKGFTPIFIKDVIDKIIEKEGKTEEQARKMIATEGMKIFLPQLNAEFGTPTPTEKAPVAPQEAPVSDKKADIERRRQEELSGENYRVVVSEEIFEGDDIDNEGDKIRLKIVTNKDGSRTLFIGSKGNLFGEGQGESWKAVDRISKDNTLTNNEYINVAWKGVGENFNTEGSNTVNKTLKSVEVINAKYDAELAALEGTKSTSATFTPTATTENLFEKVIEAQYGTFLYQFSKFIEQVGLTLPNIYGDFSEVFKKVAKNKGLSSIESSAVLTRISNNVFENRSPTSIQELIEYINSKFGLNIKLDVTAYEALSKQYNKSNTEMQMKVMANPSLSDADKLQKGKEHILLANKWYQETVNIVNTVMSQVDASIPKLQIQKATKKNTPAISNYDREEELDILAKNLKHKNKESHNRVMAVLNKYGVTFDDFIKNIDSYYKKSKSIPAATAVTETSSPVGDDFANTPSEEELMMKQFEETDTDEDVRRIILKSSKKFKKENWKSIEEWLKKNFPNLPVYRVKNIIRGTNGETAWGMFKDGAIYVYENAEVGSIYHEVFEGVWKMFTDTEEKLAIFNEFRNRKGSFTDRPSGRTVKYSEATKDEIREQLAEEFRDYVLYKKIPAKPTVGKPWIVKLFSDLVNFIKTFFTGEKAQINTANLFSKIGTGYYSQHSPYHSSLAFAKEGVIDIEEAFANSNSLFRIKDIPANEVHDIMQHMTYMTVYKLITTNKGLFSLPKIPRSQLYEELKTDIQKTTLKGWKEAKSLLDAGEIVQEEFDKRKNDSQVLWNKVTNEWEELKKKHAEYLKTYSIEFDEEDNVQINSDERSKESGWQDATKIDGYRKANSAVKLLLSSLPIMNSDGKPMRSSIFGYKLVPTTQAFMAVMNNVHTSRNLEEMLKRVHDMALSDVNYKLLYERLTGKFDSDLLSDIENLENVYDGQLLAAFWRTFKKQSPDVKSVVIFENGDVEVGDSNLSTAARQVRKEYVNNLTKIVKEGSKYMKFDAKKNAYVGDSDAVKNVNLKTVDEQIAFLKDLGIDFKYSEVVKLNREQRDSFNAAVAGIKSSIQKSKGIVTPTARSLDITNRLMSLSLIRASIDNPEFDSTFFNVKGERTQTFIGTNAASDLYDFLSQAETLDDLIGTPYEYLLTDSFAKDYVDEKTGLPVPTSIILRNMFDYETRRKKDGTSKYMKPGYADGTIDMSTGKNKQTSNLTYKQRLIQEINLNLNGYYYNLVPGDASLQAMVYMGNEVTPDNLLSGYSFIHSIFKGYVISEIELAREDRKIKSKGDRKSKDLRFLKPILGKVHDEMLKDKDFLDKNKSAQSVYEKYAPKINGAVEAFIQKEMFSLEQTLYEYGIAEKNSEGNVAVESLKFPESEGMNTGDFKRHLTSLTVNFMINNIELHKLLYSDPYQYSDELKRIKNFLSPRQSIASSPKLNRLFNKIWNREYKQGDIGYTDFTKSYFKTVTYEDVKATSELKDYGIFDETDGGGIIMFKAIRNFRIRAGEWNDDEERQFKHDVEFEKLARSGATVEELIKFNRRNPKVMSAYTPIKPIVSGGKLNNNTYNDIMLDKFALYPLSYRVMWEIANTGGKKEINAMKLYDKMQKDDIDYVIFESGRKVGAEELNPVYNENGSFNNAPFVGVIDVPFHIMSIQSEVPSKDTALVTRGSQVTKLIKLDFLEAGVPLDYLPDEENFESRYKRWFSLSEDEKKTKSKLYKEIKNNTNLLELLTDYGYQMLIKKLGIKEIIKSDGTKEYQIDNFEKVSETLREEVMKRDVNDNINDALEALKNRSAIIEATPAYQQIRNILYSIADKNVISQKITGGMKVQIASTFFEENKKVKGKNAYESDTLDFYSITKDGKTVNVCEIMVGRWFNTTMSDKELLEYLNDENNPEGQKILRGVAYRIPTQKQNSIDVFKIKQFLPKEFGDSVVVPSALVKKVGSDFDIDKLSIYFKNIYKDVSGKIKIVERKATEDLTKEYYKKVFDEILQKKQISKSELLDAIDIRINNRPDVEGLVDKYDFLIDAILERSNDLADTEEAMVKLEREIKKLNDKDLQDKLRDDYVDRMYKYALENEYIESMENLVTNPLNFERLTTPNSAEQLKDLSKKITEKLGFEAFDYSSTGNLLSRKYMSRLRHAFVTGKYAIGIAAVNQTNHALNQGSAIFVDRNKLNFASEQEKAFLKDGDIKFSLYNKITIYNKATKRNEVYPTFSFAKDALSQLTDEKLKKLSSFISDIIGQFIDGYVDISKGPWIMQLGATPNVASTWLFLIKIGVPIEDVAYFMNQPIIKDYLREIEKQGYSWLFIDTIVNEMKTSPKYKVGDDAKGKISQIPSKERLWETIGKSDLSVDEKAEQQFILDEFLKYAMMANQMFTVTQGSNFDTATLNDPFLIFKKTIQLEKARNTIISSVDDDGEIIPGVDAILNNSFLKTIYNRLLDIRNAFAQILTSDKGNVRDVLHNVLREYADLPDGDFVKIAQMAVSNLFDWAVQIDRNLNSQITRVLLSDDSVAKRMSDFVQEVIADNSHVLHNNQIINLVVPHFSAKPNSVQNLKIKNKDNKVYDQNQIIYAFHELKKHLKGVDDKLYGDLLSLAILQSGLTNSPISFTSMIPYEDFTEFYNSTLSTLNSFPNLENFYKLNVFQRKNWNNDDITPYRRAKWKTDFTGIGSTYNNNMKFGDQENAKLAMESGKLPQLLKLSPLAKEASNDVIVYSWEKQIDLLTEEEKKGKTYGEMVKLVKSKKSEMKKNGDFSYIQKGLFKKVYVTPTEPFKIKSGGYDTFVYKMINAWGESKSIENSYFSANEFYATAKKSVIDNGFNKVENEVSDDTVRAYFNIKTKTESPKATPAPTAPIADKATTNTAKQVEAIVSAPGYVKETAKKHLAKELFKIRQATQFIGTGGGNDSTTQRMENAYAQIGLANTGNYTSSDLVYVSSNGKRANRYSPLGGIPSGLQGPYQNIDKVIAAGGRIIMDTAQHLANTRSYNIGEADLAVYLANKGYTRDDATGIWSKSTTPTTFSSEKQERLTQLEKQLEEKGLGPNEVSELNKLRAEKGKQIKKDC